MFISDLSGCDMTIHVSKDDKELDLVGLVYEPSEKEDKEFVLSFQKQYPGVPFCILEPIHQRDRLLNFEADIKIDVIADTGGLPLKWTDVKIINIYLPVKGAVHFVLSRGEGVQSNRRNGFRLFLGVFGHMKVGDKDVPNIMIKDISLSGIGIKAPNGQYEVGTVVKVQFMDQSMRFEIDAKIVRCVEEQNEILLGCRFNKRSEAIARYINSKQQARARLR